MVMEWSDLIYIVCCLVLLVLIVLAVKVYNTLDGYAGLAYNGGGCSVQGTHCAFNEPFFTDSGYRSSVLTNWTIKNAIDSTISLIGQTSPADIAKTDPVFAYSILNPWFVFDNSLFTTQYVYFSSTLNSFTINGTVYSNFSNSGINLSYYAGSSGPVYYLFIDTNILISLPKGIIDGSTRVDTLSNLNTVLTNYFYNFNQGACKLQDASGQKATVSECIYFVGSGLSGLVTALRRVIIDYLPDDVLSAYYQNVSSSIQNGVQIDYLQFFMFLAAQSKNLGVNYTFVSS